MSRTCVIKLRAKCTQTSNFSVVKNSENDLNCFTPTFQIYFVNTAITHKGIYRSHDLYIQKSYIYCI